MRTVHYRNDFDFILRLRDSLGNDIGFPPGDWCARFWTTSRAGYFEVSSVNGILTNCFNDEGQIHVVANNHNLKPGVLMCEFQTVLPDNRYADGSQYVITPDAVDIELVCGKGYISNVEAELALPLVKGEPFTFTDFTPEQIAELRQPAVDAAKELERFVNTAEEAERTRVANETTREEQETARKDAETKRAEAETQRVSAEDGRKEAESLRVSAEEKREDAEQKRATEFAGFKETIDAKPNFADLSTVLGEPTSEESDNKFEARTGFTREDMKKDLFIDMWNDACRVGSVQFGSYNTETGFFELNGLTDITYEQAIRILNAPMIFNPNQQWRYWNYAIRTNIFQGNISTGPYNFDNTFNLSGIEVIRIPNNSTIQNMGAMLANCGNLKKVIGVLDIHLIASNTRVTPTMLPNCTEIWLKGIKTSLVMTGFIILDFECWCYMVQQAINTAPITLTVHPDIYAKLIDETNTEWHQLLLDAAEKQIQFATA